MKKIKPPVAKIVPYTEQHHGYTKSDNYRWLKAENWQEVMHDPSKLPQDIRDYLEAENAYQKEQMADTDKLQEVLFAEIKGRIKEDDMSVPTPDGPWLYYSSFVVGGQYPRFHRKRRDNLSEEITLLDCNELAKGKEYFSLGGAAVSHDHSLGAWSSDDKGSEYYTIRVRDLTTLKDLDDAIINTSGEATWALDGKSFFYTEQDENHRPLRTYRHVLGTPQSADVLVYEEKDTGLFTGVGSTNSDQYIVIIANDHDTSESWIIDAAKPESKPVCISPRKIGFEYDIEHRGDKFIIKTNADGAEDYKLVTAPVTAPSPENWTDLIPHRPGVFLVDYIVLKDWLVRLERENALPRIVIRHFDTGAEHEIAFKEEAYSLGFGDMREFETDMLRFTYSSPTTPAQVYDYNMKTRERVLMKTQEVPSGHDAENYVARRIMAPAHDGEMVPVTLLYRKGTKLDGSAPLWLYGYGSYGISLPAGFNTNILSLVDRGFIYATAHIRGGQEKGRRWYKTGKLEHKANTFKP